MTALKEHGLRNEADSHFLSTLVFATGRKYAEDLAAEHAVLALASAKKDSTLGDDDPLLGRRIRVIPADATLKDVKKLEWMVIFKHTHIQIAPQVVNQLKHLIECFFGIRGVEQAIKLSGRCLQLSGNFSFPQLCTFD